MSSLLRRVGVVIGGGLVLLLGSTLWREHGGQAKLDAARGRARAACAAYAAEPGLPQTDLCLPFGEEGTGYRAMSVLHASEARVAEAKEALARADLERAETHLASVMDDVKVGNGRHFFAELTTAAMVRSVLDVLDGPGRALDARARRRILANVRLHGAVHPFEALRMAIVWEGLHPERPLFDGEFPRPSRSKAELVSETEQVAATFDAMATAVLADEVTRCERTARAVEGSSLWDVDIEASHCAMYARVVATGRRLAAAQRALGLEDGSR